MYDYFLILDDEVCQSYPPSGVQRYLKLAQVILRLAGKEKLEWVYLPVISPSLTDSTRCLYQYPACSSLYDHWPLERWLSQNSTIEPLFVALLRNIHRIRLVVVALNGITSNSQFKTQKMHITDKSVPTPLF